jgi:hypothetical protein
MFNDSIQLTNGTAVRNVSLIDTDNGRSKRALNQGGGTFSELAIAHQESAENKPVNTDRHLVRNDLIKEDPLTHKPVKASCQITIVVPRSLVTQAEVETLVTEAINFLITGGVADYAGEKVSNGWISPAITRLLSGES